MLCSDLNGKEIKKKKRGGWRYTCFKNYIYIYYIIYIYILYVLNRPPWWLSSKDPPVTQETLVQSLGREDPMEEGMTTHFSILAWRIPWTKELGGLYSMASQRVGHD